MHTKKVWNEDARRRPIASFLLFNEQPNERRHRPPAIAQVLFGTSITYCYCFEFVTYVLS